MADDVTVEQCDRDAAAQMYGRFGDYHNATAAKNGERDNESVVQAFARHRTQANETMRAEVERLFGLLDDIDTADDIAKSDLAHYRDLVRNLANKRFDGGITTDGYTLDLSALSGDRA